MRRQPVCSGQRVRTKQRISQALLHLVLSHLTPSQAAYLSCALMGGYDRLAWASSPLHWH